MIITDKFVFIHMPKTGGTFVTSILRKIHEARGDRIEERRADQKPKSRFSLREWFNPRQTVLLLNNRQGASDWNQHGTTGQIPPEHLHKPILTVLRNPYDRYVSQYEFKWWIDRLDAFTSDMDALKRAYPHYPDISFADFVAISNSFFRGGQNDHFGEDDFLGRHTCQFAAYYFTNPARLRDIDANYLATKQYWQDTRPNLRYIFQEDLNRQLHDFLLEMGYDPAEIAFILNHGKIMPKEGGRTAEQTWESYYTPELKAWLRHHERMLFEMFPQWDV